MRRIKFNHGNEIPRMCWFVDVIVGSEKTDTTNGLMTFTLKKVLTSNVITEEPKRRKEFSFDDPMDFWNLIETRGKLKRSTWLFIRDPYFILDILGFWKLVDDGKVKFIERGRESKDEGKGNTEFKGCICMNSVPFFIRCRLGGKSLTIVSIDNYGDKLSPFIQQNKAEMMRELKNKDQEERELKITWASVRATENYFSHLFDKWAKEDIGCWQTTASRLAMRAYQHHLTKANNILWSQEEKTKDNPKIKKKRPPHPSLKLIMFHDDMELKSFEREGYFGGETQLFYYGRWDKTCHVVDIRSFYPWIATQFELPYQFVRKIDSCSIEYLRNQLEVYEAIAEVQIAGPNTEYPVRIEDKNTTRKKRQDAWYSDLRVIYPEGIYWTKLTSLELLNAIDNGHVKKVGAVALYKKGFILKTFMEEWIEKRRIAEETSDYAMTILAKLIANSLIGKFGQHSTSWQESPHEEPPVNWGEYWKINWDKKTYEKYRSIGGYAQRYMGARETKQSFTPIPAAVCSIGRTIMRAVRRKLPQDSVLLQVTDGFVVTDEGLEAAKKLLHFEDNIPGAWRVNGSFPDAEFWTPQHYRIGDGYCLAGIEKERVFSNGSFMFLEQTHPLTSIILGMPVGKAVRQLRQYTPQVICFQREKLPNGFTLPLLLL